MTFFRYDYAPLHTLSICWFIGPFVPFSPFLVNILYSFDNNEWNHEKNIYKQLVSFHDLNCIAGWVFPFHSLGGKRAIAPILINSRKAKI